MGDFEDFCKKFGNKFVLGADLKEYTTFKIGGPAKYLLKLDNEADIVEALNKANDSSLKTLVIGGGSNLLLPDAGFEGLVIKIDNHKISIDDEKINVDAGANLKELVLSAINQGLKGLEYLIGIPGTVGGAIRGNAGAYGREIKNTVEKAKVIIKKNGEYKIKKLNNSNLNFKYRSSIIKENNYIVISAVLKLEKGNREILQKIAKDIISKRNSSQPYEYPSAGCVFKNIEYNDSLSYLSEFAVHNKIPVARLIDELGLKGRSIGGAKVSEKHANFIVNIGNAKYSDVVELIDLIKQEIKAKFKIEVEEEIKIIS